MELIVFRRTIGASVVVLFSGISEGVGATRVREDMLFTVNFPFSPDAGFGSSLLGVQVLFDRSGWIGLTSLTFGVFKPVHVRLLLVNVLLIESNASKNNSELTFWVLPERFEK